MVPLIRWLKGGGRGPKQYPKKKPKKDSKLFIKKLDNDTKIEEILKKSLGEESERLFSNGPY